MADATPPTNPGPGRKFAELYIPHKHATTFDAPSRFKSTQPSWGAVPGAVGGGEGEGEGQPPGMVAGAGVGGGVGGGRPDTRNAFAENWLALERWARDLRDQVGGGAGEVGFGFVSDDNWPDAPEHWDILFAKDDAVDVGVPESIHLGIGIQVPSEPAGFGFDQSYNILVGNHIGDSDDGTQKFDITFDNTIIGHWAARIASEPTGSGDHTLRDSVILGNWALTHQSDRDGLEIQDCVFIGTEAAQNLFSPVSFGSDGVQGAVAIGRKALVGGGDEGGQGGVVAVGYGAGFARNGWANVMIGENAGAASIAGGSLSPTDGRAITAVGHRAGAASVVKNSVVHVGTSAGEDNPNSQVISIGQRSASDAKSGAENVIAFGRSAGYGDHRGDRLIIHYSNRSSVSSTAPLNELLIDGRFYDGTDAEQSDPFVAAFDYKKGLKVRGLLEVAPPSAASSAQTELILTDANGDRKAVTVDGSGNLQVGTPSGAISP